MSRQQIHKDNLEMDRVHRKTVIRKIERIQTLRALVEMWQERSDRDYLRGLRARLHQAEQQLTCMRP